MGKKVLVSLIVLGLMVGLCVWGNGLCGAIEGARKGTEQGVKSMEQKGKLKAQRSMLKAKQVGTPTVQQLLDKVEENYHKITDLKADMVYTTEKPGGWGYPILTDKMTKAGKFYFKAPDKIKWEDPNDHSGDTVFKGLTKYVRRYPGDSSQLPWYTLLDPDYLSFYWRLDEIITKFDTQVIDNPQTDVWVIEAVPKASNPEDDYNYPLPTMKLQIFVDYEKGVITKIGRKYSERLLQDFSLINNIWMPTKFVKTRFKENFTMGVLGSDLDYRIHLTKICRYAIMETLWQDFGEFNTRR